jgi:hypothetical protein
MLGREVVHEHLKAVRVEVGEFQKEARASRGLNGLIEYRSSRSDTERGPRVLSHAEWIGGVWG